MVGLRFWVPGSGERRGGSAPGDSRRRRRTPLSFRRCRFSIAGRRLHSRSPIPSARRDWQSGGLPDDRPPARPFPGPAGTDAGRTIGRTKWGGESGRGNGLERTPAPGHADPALHPRTSFSNSFAVAPAGSAPRDLTISRGRLPGLPRRCAPRSSRLPTNRRRAFCPGPLRPDPYRPDPPRRSSSTRSTRNAVGPSAATRPTAPRTAPRPIRLPARFDLSGCRRRAGRPRFPRSVRVRPLRARPFEPTRPETA